MDWKIFITIFGAVFIAGINWGQRAIVSNIKKLLLTSTSTT